MTPQWNVVRTRPLGEYIAADGLEQAGLQVFCPCIQTRRPRPGWQNAPLFPGYLFVRCDSIQMRWSSFHQVPQVLGLVSFEGIAPSVPDEVIEELSQRVEAINQAGGLLTCFVPGQKVRLVSGNIESLAEVLEEPRTANSRVKILLHFLGRTVPAQVPREDLQTVATEESWAIPRGARPRRTRGNGRWVRGWAPRSLVGPSDESSRLQNERLSS